MGIVRCECRRRDGEKRVSGVERLMRIESEELRRYCRA